MQEADEEELLAPETPTNLTVNPYNGGYQLAWWDNSSTEEGFRVEGLGQSGNWELIATVASDITTYFYTPSFASTSYSFRVYAYLEDLESGYSNVATYSIDPQAPTNLYIANSGDNWVELNWADPSSTEDGFVLEYSQDAGNSWAELAYLDTDITNYTSDPLDPGSYLFRVKAIYGTIESEYSNTVQFDVVVGPPTNFGINSSGENWVMFTWEDPSSIETGFRIDYSLDLGTTWYERVTVAGNTTDWTDYIIEPGTSYTCRIVTVLEGGESEPSPSILFASYVYAPTNLTAEEIDDNGTPAVRLNWTDNSSVETQYTVERRTDSMGWNSIGSLDANTTSAIDRGAIQNEQNYYRLYAETANSQSDYSNEASVYLGGSTFNVIASTGFEGMQIGYFPSADGGLYWNLIDRDDMGVGVFVFDNVVYEGSRCAAIVDNSTFFADVMMGHEQLPGIVQTRMKTFCQDKDKVANLVGYDNSGHELFFLSFWWSGNFQYYDGSTWIDTGIPFPTGEWFDLTIEASMDTDHWSVYVNGNTIIDNLPFLVSSDHLYTGTLFRLNANSYMSTPIYIDNVQVGTISR